MTTLAILMIFGGMMLMIATIPIHHSVRLLVAGLALAIVGVVVGATEQIRQTNACEGAGGVYVSGDCFEADSRIDVGRR